MMHSEEFLKPFKRPKEYYKENDLFLISIPSNLRQPDEYEYCLGKDIFNRNGNWAGNVALKRIQLKYCYSPVRKLEDSTFDDLNNSNNLQTERDSFNNCTNGPCQFFVNENDFSTTWSNQNNLLTWKENNSNHNSFSSEMDKQELKASFHMPGITKLNERQESATSETFETIEQNLSQPESRSAFGSFPYLKSKKMDKIFENPVHNTTVESMISKISKGNPTCIIYLDLDFHTKFLWKMKEAIPSGIYFIAFFGKKNRVSKSPNDIVSVLFQTERFHIHPLAGIKKKGAAVKNIYKTVIIYETQEYLQAEFLKSTVCY